MDKTVVRKRAGRRKRVIKVVTRIAYTRVPRSAVGSGRMIVVVPNPVDGIANLD